MLDASFADIEQESWIGVAKAVFIVSNFPKRVLVSGVLIVDLRQEIPATVAGAAAMGYCVKRCLTSAPL